MSLRDYFASQALAATIESHWAMWRWGDIADIKMPDMKGMAHDAYAQADAMLTERAKNAD